MTYHPTITKTGDFATRELEIYRDLVRAIAERDGLDLSHPRSKFSAETTADEVLKMWPRLRREPQDEIERLCQANLDNEHAFRRHREEIQAIRAAHRATTAEPAPDPNLRTFTLKDEATGRYFKLTVPADQVSMLSKV